MIESLGFLHTTQIKAPNQNQLKMKDILSKQEISAVTTFNVTPITSWYHWPSHQIGEEHIWF